MFNRLILFLPQDEFTALVSVAIAELRTPADQARHMLRDELVNRKALTLEHEDRVEKSHQPTAKDESSC